MRTQLNSIMLDVVNFGVYGRGERMGINFLPLYVFVGLYALQFVFAVKLGTEKDTRNAIIDGIINIGLVYWMIAPVL